MLAVAEENEIRYAIDTHPWEGLLLLMKRRKLVDGRAIFLYASMAGHALSRSRESRAFLFSCLGMTDLALESYRCMLLMAERNRLLGRGKQKKDYAYHVFNIPTAVRRLSARR
jgi:hypothetical protein